MAFRFPLSDVKIILVEKIPDISDPTFQDQFVQLDQHQFRLHVPHIADFYAYNGSEIQIMPLSSPIEQNGIELYLNGSLLGAIMHQRIILPLHASSLRFADKGIVICGDSGAGKSTLSYALSQFDDYRFISDDITSIHNDNKMAISPLPGRIKLWRDAIEKFDLSVAKKDQVRKELDKFFVKPADSVNEDSTLNLILFIELKEVSKVQIAEITGANKFEIIMNNIYRKEYLKGMNETELSYFGLLTKICDRIPFFSITRGENTKIEEVLNLIDPFIRKELK